MRIDVCLCCGMAMLSYIRQYEYTAICIYGYMYIRIALRTILHRMTLYMSPS